MRAGSTAPGEGPVVLRRYEFASEVKDLGFERGSLFAGLANGDVVRMDAKTGRQA